MKSIAELNKEIETLQEMVRERDHIIETHIRLKNTENKCLLVTTPNIKHIVEQVQHNAPRQYYDFFEEMKKELGKKTEYKFVDLDEVFDYKDDYIESKKNELDRRERNIKASEKSFNDALDYNMELLYERFSMKDEIEYLVKENTRLNKKVTEQKEILKVFLDK